MGCVRCLWKLTTASYPLTSTPLPLPRLALGVETSAEAAEQCNVGHYAADVELHGDAAAAALGGQRQPSLAPAANPGCAMRTASGDHVLEAPDAAALRPGGWPWQNCSAWPLTDQLLGAVLARARGGVRLPMVLGVTCSLGIATAAGEPCRCRCHCCCYC